MRSMIACKKPTLALLALIILFPGRPITCYGEGFIKAGFVFSPADDELADRWLLSGGGDFSPASSLYVGFELAGGFYTDRISAFETIQTAPINAFLNMKYKAPRNGVRPFAGFGLGLVSLLRSRGDRQNYNADLGFHFMTGLEFGALSGNAFLVELQGQKNLTQNGSPFAWIALAGLRF